jgi:O-antigen/teichoic acid export membrane protein
MSGIGITNVYIRYSSIFATKQEISNINRLLSTGMACTLILSAAVILCAWYFLPYTFPILQIPDNLYPTSFILIFGTIAVFSLEMTLGSYKYLLQGLQKVGLQWMIDTFCQFLETVLVVVFLYSGFGIFSLLYAYSIRVLLAIIVNAIVCYYYIPNLSIRPKFFDPSMLNIFYNFGGIIQLRSMIGVVNRSLMRIVSGIYVGSQAAALCDLGEKFPLTATYITTSPLYVFLPAGSRFHAKGEESKIRNLYLYSCRYISILTGLCLGFLAPFSLTIVTFWLGNDPMYQIVALIMASVALPYHIVVLTGPASAVFRSINMPAKELVYGICEIAMAILGAMIGVYFFGYSILVLCISIASTFLITSGFYTLYTNHFLNIKQNEFLQKVIAPGLLPYLIASLIASVEYQWFHNVYTSRWDALYSVLMAFTAYSIITIPLYFFYILNSSEREHLYSHYLNKFFKSKTTKVENKRAINAKSIGKAQLIWNNVHLIKTQVPFSDLRIKYFNKKLHGTPESEFYRRAIIFSRLEKREESHR